MRFTGSKGRTWEHLGICQALTAASPLSLSLDLLFLCPSRKVAALRVPGHEDKADIAQLVEQWFRKP